MRSRMRAFDCPFEVNFLQVRVTLARGLNLIAVVLPLKTAGVVYRGKF